MQCFTVYERLLKDRTKKKKLTYLRYEMHCDKSEWFYCIALHYAVCLYRNTYFFVSPSSFVSMS